MRRSRIVLFFAALVMVTAGCEQSPANPAVSAMPSALASSTNPKAIGNAAKICDEWRNSYLKTIGPDSTDYAEARAKAEEAFARKDTKTAMKYVNDMLGLYAAWGLAAKRLSDEADSPTLKAALAAQSDQLAALVKDGGIYNVDIRTALVKAAQQVLAACPDDTPLPAFPPA